MIIVVDPSLTYRGISHYAHNLRGLFTTDGHKVRIVRPHIKNRVYSILWEVLGLYLVHVKKGDVLVHVSGRVGLIPALFCSSNIVVIHDLMRLHTCLSGKRDRSGNRHLLDLKSLYQTLLFLVGLRRSRMLICNSFYVEKELGEVLGLNGVCVLYPPPSFSKEEILTKVQKEEISVGRGSTRKYGLWICGGTPNKNFKEGMKWLENNSLPIELDILGISSTRQSKFLEESSFLNASTGSDYRLLDFIANKSLVGRYLSCDFCLCLSNDEGFGIPFLDALMFGLPIIATKIPTYTEIYGLVEEKVISYSSKVFWVDLGSANIDVQLDEICRLKPLELDRKLSYCRNLEAFKRLNMGQYSKIGDWGLPNKSE